MLKKLLKYEFRATGARFLTSFAVYAVAVGALFLLFFNADASFQPLALFLICLSMLALFIVLFLTLFQRYNANLYGSEGYLMFTLPAKGRMLLLSKLVSAIVWVVLYGAVFSLTVLAVALKYGKAVSVTRLFRAVWLNRGEIPLTLVVTASAVCFIAMAIYFSITVSKLPVWRGAGALMGIVTFFAVNIVSYIPSIIKRRMSWTVAVTTNGHSQIVEKTNSVGQTIGSMWFNAGYMLVLSAALFFAAAYLIERHTSLK